MNRSDRRIEVNGAAFRLLRSPRPAGSSQPTTVLVHGVGMSHRYLSRLHDRLAARTEVISIDLPGFGGLPKPPADLDVSRMAESLGEVLASLGRGRMILVGHSMGAQWAVETAIQRPGEVAMVVAMGPVADERHRTAAAQARALAMDTLGETPSINAIVFTDYLRCGVPWYLAQLRHMLRYPMDEKVRELSVPLLVLRGGHDPVAGSDWCRRLRDRAPVSRFVQVPRAFHVVQESAPGAVASAILHHANEVWRLPTAAPEQGGR